MSGDACYLEQIATALPRQVLRREQAAALLQDGCINRRSLKLMQRILRLTGIEQRHLAALDFQAAGAGPGSLFRPTAEQPHGPGMEERGRCFDAAAGELVRAALAQLDRGRLACVDTLVTASCTHASSPGLEHPVFAHGAVPATVDRWNLGFMGCSAALAALRLAHGLVAARRTCLIVACELSSLHFQYTDETDQMTANLLFSDGTAAALVSPRPSSVRVLDCACTCLPEMADQMRWYAASSGLKLKLSQELPATLAAHLPETVRRLLARNNVSLSDVRHWLVHPGGPEILDSVEGALELPAGAVDVSREVLRNFGNMSSPTILFIFQRFVELQRRGLALAMAFGPGLTIELALLQLCP